MNRVWLVLGVVDGDPIAMSPKEISAAEGDLDDGDDVPLVVASECIPLPIHPSTSQSSRPTLLFLTQTSLPLPPTSLVPPHHDFWSHVPPPSKFHPRRGYPLYSHLWGILPPRCSFCSSSIRFHSRTASPDT